MKRRVESYMLRREKMKNYATGLAEKDYSKLNEVTLKWSEVLESAFDYYYAEYIPAWALNETSFNNSGDKLFISKKSNEWVSWEKIAESERPDIATLFDLLPDLPGDDQYWQILREIRNSGIEEPEDYFWENMFSYKQANEVKINDKKYRIEWEA